MSQDKYAVELEKAVFNWYYGGENAAPEPMFHAVQAGLKNDMQMLVPIETPASMLKSMGNIDEIKVGDTFSADEEIHIKFRRLIVNEQGQYYIPIFTSESELNKGDSTSAMEQPLSTLFEAIKNWPDCLGFIVNPWDKKLMLSKDIIPIVTSHKEKSHISFIRGSVVDMHVGAIVNAANSSLLGGGGVDGAIHRAAGPELVKACRLLHGCKTGEAKITGSYGISHADFIIHTVGPVYRGEKRDAELLSCCYKNSLDLALANGCTSIAFPGISTGVYGYPLEDAARISLLTVVRWLEEHSDCVMDVYFCCFKDTEMAAYTKLLNGHNDGKNSGADSGQNRRQDSGPDKE